MDAWREDQVKRMELGGNKRCLDFFKSQPDWREGMSISEKYNTEFARHYREKLAAEVEGRAWTPSPKQGSGAGGGGAGAGAGAGSTTQTYNLGKTAGSNTRSTDNDFSWDTESSTPAQSSSSFSRRPDNTTTNSNPLSYQSAGTGTSSFSSTSPNARNEAYFAKLGAENSSRPDSMAPNQGGKYGGFGNPNFSSPAPAARGGAVTEGAKLASAGAAIATQKISETVETTSKALQDGQVVDKVLTGVKDISAKAVEATSRGVGLGKEVIEGKRSIGSTFQDWQWPKGGSGPSSGQNQNGAGGFPDGQYHREHQDDNEDEWGTWQEHDDSDGKGQLSGSSGGNGSVHRAVLGEMGYGATDSSDGAKTKSETGGWKEDNTWENF
ncbi:ADP-ribosylation factor GTPase-activating protein 1 [Gonapodya sp. JEL0774]|nr:ADP-ribosylation factor GTPase-activating protein 1 [Gonapodya sp. JEL0774]